MGQGWSGAGGMGVGEVDPRGKTLSTGSRERGLGKGGAEPPQAAMTKERYEEGGDGEEEFGRWHGVGLLKLMCL